MATILANLSSPVLIHGVKTLPRLIFKSGFCPTPDRSLERRGRVAFLAKAAGESSETSTSLSIVGSVQKVWDKSEDRVGLIGLGFAGIVALWASVNLISAIDKAPVIPSLFEFIGILYSAGRVDSKPQQISFRYLGTVNNPPLPDMVHIKLHQLYVAVSFYWY
ncbi:CURVATURE THYLAKOID 1C, chloroplastic-like protein [Drosera capensis]